MGRNNNKSVKVVHGGDHSDEESKNQPIRFVKKKLPVPTTTADGSDSNEEEGKQSKKPVSVFSEAEKQRNAERLVEIKWKREMAAKEKAEEQEKLAEAKIKQAEILAEMALKKQQKG
jgi:nucleoid-associated protein YgaU